MQPFITVALVSDSFAIGNYPYKPSMPFMREQIPKSLSLAWFCLCDLHPHTFLQGERYNYSNSEDRN